MENNPNDNNTQQQDMQNDIMNDDLKDGLNKAKQRKAEKENSIAHKGAEQAKQQVKTALKNQVKKKFGNAFSKIKGKLMQIFVPAIIIAIIVVVTIGLISFILNMPGLMRGKIDELLSAINENVTIYLWGDNNKLNPDNINHEKRLELLNYISSDLGFDVIGFGFVPVAVYDEGNDPETGESNIGKQKIIDYDEQLGWMSLIDGDKEGKLVPDNDLLYYYLMANERAYVKNDDGVFGIFSSDSNEWKGMLNIDLSKLESAAASIIPGESIKVNRESKTLEIRNSNPHWGELLNQDVFTFSLDGWTGRYGTPLEFSLALHLATMSSGMVKELITNEDLQTQVHIELQKADCNINFKFYTDGGKKHIDIPFNPKGNVDDLANKIKRGASVVSISDDDLSIRGIVYASKLNYENQLPEDIIDPNGNFKKISRHIDTIAAVLSSDDMAVITNGNTFSYSDSAYAHMYGLRTFNKSNAPSEIAYLADEYNISSGAYICSYSGDQPNTSTGMLGTIYNSDFDGITGDHIYYDLLYQPTAEDDHIYDLVYRGKDENGNITEINLGAQVIIPRPNAGECSNDYITVVKTKGLWDLYEKASDPNVDFTISGLSMSDVATISKKQAYDKLFGEIDWFMGTLCLLETYYGDGSFSLPFYDKVDFSDEDGYNYYQKKYNYFIECFNAGDSDGAKETLKTLYDSLLEDYIYIKNMASNVNGKKVIDEILNAKAPGVTVDVLRNIVEKFGGNPDSLSDETVEYSQPRITKVIKHWYKDIDFGEEDTQAYTKSYDTISLKYTGDDIGNEIEIVTELTPVNNQYLYNQENQPRVIKGETVYLEGQIVGTVDEVYGGEQPAEDYRWGDGYRATKKIFTQGFYYTFDGSAETSRSIYWQQQIENTEAPTTYLVSVSGGRILYVTPNLNAGGEHVPEHEINASEYNWPSGVNVEYLSENKGLSAGYYKGLGENEVVRFYHITIGNTDNVKYLSPTKYSYEEVKTRADQINDIWKSMGVVSLRQQLSFDNVSANGEVMANTGLSILKNCDTQDADYIYRDLKEMLLDLGYYTQAEFDQLDSAVLRWFIPAYIPKVWPQNSVEDFKFACTLYPAEGYVDEEGFQISYDDLADDNTPESEILSHGSGYGKENYTKEENETTKDKASSTNDTKNQSGDAKENEETTDKTNDEDDELSLTVKDKGFMPNLDIIAPGDCTIIGYDKEQKTIEIRFNSTYQPEISNLNGYTMIITGVTINDNIQTEDVYGNKVTYDIDECCENENIIIKVGSYIAKTGRDEINVILQNDIGRILSNVNDYMDIPQVDLSELACFYFLPYESEGDPGIVAWANQTSAGYEIAAGLCQWTVLPNMNNISPLCGWLYEKDPVLCAELETFVSWTAQDIIDDCYNGQHQLQEAFRTVADRSNPDGNSPISEDKFFMLQIEYAKEEKEGLTRRLNCEWILDRSPATIGTFYSLINWGPYLGWDRQISDDMSDQEIIYSLLKYACTKKSTQGSLNSRWESQARLAIDLLSGQFTELEDWIKHKAKYPQYANGHNTGYLLGK